MKCDNQFCRMHLNGLCTGIAYSKKNCIAYKKYCAVKIKKHCKFSNKQNTSCLCSQCLSFKQCIGGEKLDTGNGL